MVAILSVMWVMMSYSAYIRNPEYAGRFNSYLEFMGSSGFLTDFKYMHIGFLAFAVFSITPLWASLGCFNTWNVDVSFDDSAIR